MRFRHASLHIGILLAGATAGCGASKNGSPASATAPEGSHPIDGGTWLQKARAREAIKTVQNLWDDPAFWKLVEERPWLPGPNEPWLKGTDLITHLRPLSPAAQEYRIGIVGCASFFGAMGRTTAQTSVCGHVTLNSTHVVGTSFLLNTIAHENTHIPGRGAGLVGCTGDHAGEFRYTDGGHEADTLPWLVSYAFGDLAQCFWEAGRDPKKTTQCFAHRIDGDAQCRLAKECCAPSTQVNVAAIRASHGCGAVDCTLGEALCPKPW